MHLPDPVQLFKDCLNNPEPLLDENYFGDELIISESNSNKPTDLMDIQTSIIERLTVAKIALEDNDINLFQIQVEKIDKSLTSDKQTNFLEIASFFPVLDVSFSIYCSLIHAERLDFLGKAIEIFIRKRHSIYLSHGYSPTTIQSRKDFEKHKTQGNLGQNKLKGILEKFGFDKLNHIKHIDSSNNYTSADDSLGGKVLDEFQSKGELWISKWSENREGKKVDMIWNSNKNYFICEAKHVKEDGGGQNKQINELISLLDNKSVQQPNNFFYISFLDGIYFNKFIKLKKSNSKIYKQKQRIISVLNHPSKRNYFVNTYGIKQILRNLFIK